MNYIFKNNILLIFMCPNICWPRKNLDKISTNEGKSQRKDVLHVSLNHTPRNAR